MAGSYGTPGNPQAPNWDPKRKPMVDQSQAGLKQPTGQRNAAWDPTATNYGEQYFQNNQAQWSQPTASQQNWQQTQGQYANHGPTTNYAEEAYRRYQPQAYATDPNLGGYYDRAMQRTGADIDKAMAARGMYNSGAATSAIANASVDLNAERANREAQYGLDRAGAMRADAGMGGTLASAADASSAAGSQDALSWLTGGAGAAGNVDSANLAWLNSGQNAATTAQGLARGRQQDYFNNNFTFDSFMAGLANDSYNGMLSSDADLMDKILETKLANAKSMQNSEAANKEEFKNDESHMMDMAKGGMSFM